MNMGIEWGFLLDCELNGCSPKCDDDGRVVLASTQPHKYPPDEAQLVYGHATVLVCRTVTRSEWEPHDGVA